MSRHCKHGVIADMCNSPECCPLAAAKEKAEARRSAETCASSPFNPCVGCAWPKSCTKESKCYIVEVYEKAAEKNPIPNATSPSVAATE